MVQQRRQRWQRAMGASRVIAGCIGLVCARLLHGSHLTASSRGRLRRPPLPHRHCRRIPSSARHWGEARRCCQGNASVGPRRKSRPCPCGRTGACGQSRWPVWEQGTDACACARQRGCGEIPKQPDCYKRSPFDAKEAHLSPAIRRHAAHVHLPRLTVTRATALCPTAALTCTASATCETTAGTMTLEGTAATNSKTLTGPAGGFSPSPCCSQGWWEARRVARRRSWKACEGRQRQGARLVCEACHSDRGGPRRAGPGRGERLGCGAAWR